MIQTLDNAILGYLLQGKLFRARAEQIAGGAVRSMIQVKAATGKNLILLSWQVQCSAACDLNFGRYDTDYTNLDASLQNCNILNGAAASSTIRKQTNATDLITTSYGYIKVTTANDRPLEILNSPIMLGPGQGFVICMQTNNLDLRTQLFAVELG